MIGKDISVGDTICICSDLHMVKALQVGHGEWVDQMKNVSRMLRSGHTNILGIGWKVPKDSMLGLCACQLEGAQR